MQEFHPVNQYIAIAEGLAQKSPSAPKAQRFLAMTYNYIIGPSVGTETLNVGNSKVAQTYARKALAIEEKLAASDAKNVQARYDLAFAYEGMGFSLRLTQPAIAAGWYQKSISLTKEVAPLYPAGSQVQELIADLDEELAAAQGGRAHASERLRLLEEANGIWREMISAGKPQYRIGLMRSDCKLTDAELASNDLITARQYADLALPLLKAFKLDSPSLLVLRELGFCNESLGNLERRIGTDPSASPSQREAALAASRQWYQKSADVWAEWNRRGAATPESELERRKVEGFLARWPRG
jgi:hypothetical protein